MNQCIKGVANFAPLFFSYLYGVAMIRKIILIVFVCWSCVSFATNYSFKDPINDDFGYGEVIYPHDTTLKPGDLDLTNFEIIEDLEEDGYWFEASFRSKIKHPNTVFTEINTNLDRIIKYDFYAFNIDVYMKFNEQQPLLNGAAPGRRVVFSSSSKWQKCVLLTSRPNIAKLILSDELQKVASEKDSYKDNYSRDKKELFEAQLDNFIEQHYFFPKKIKVKFNRISFFVPKAFFEHDISDTTEMAVLVTGADPSPRITHDLFKEYGPNVMVVPVLNGRTPGAFGGVKELGKAQPYVIDMLLPTVEAQQYLLGRFSQPADTFTTIEMFPLAKYTLFKPELKSVQHNESGVAGVDVYNVVTSDSEREKTENLSNEELISIIDTPTSHVQDATASGGRNASAEKPETQQSLQVQQNQTRSPLDRLRDLKQLKNEGLIDDKEYQQLRIQILNSL